ncbi:MAG: DUF333 domain-containing protein [Omnitrophica WOR_2 bacterium]
MNAKIKTLIIGIVLSLFVLSACATRIPQSAPATSTPDKASIANPAAVNCEQKGYRSEIRTADDGSQSAACVFPDGSECDEWAFFRGECAPGTQTPSTSLDTVLAVGERPQATLDETQNKAIEIVRNQLASQLKVEGSSLDMISIEAIDWPDACLGLPQEGEMCAQVITPGFLITFASGDKNYAFHTDLAAGVLRQEAAVIN